MKRAVAYLRCSTRKQANKDLSIPAQREAVEGFARSLGAVVVQWFEDPGVRATHTPLEERPQEIAALDFIKKHGNDIDFFLVDDFKRMARDPYEGAYIRKIACQSGVQVLALKQPTTNDEAANILLESVYDAMAKYEMRLLAAKVRGGQRQALAKGRFPYPKRAVPYGRRREERGEGESKYFVLVIDQETAPVVARIYSLYLDGNGYKAIAVKLTAEQVPTPSGTVRPWQPSAVGRILTCPSYYGAAIARRRRKGHRKHRPLVNEEIVNETAWEPIVPKATWEKVQALREAKRRGAPCALPEGTDLATERRIPLGDHGIFTPLLRCGGCGGRVRINRGGSAKAGWIYYYTCASRLENRASCAGMTVRVDSLDPLLLGRMERDVLTVDEVRRIITETCERLRDTAAADALSRRASLEARIAELQAIIDNATLKVLDGTLRQSEVDRVMGPRREQHDQALRTLAELPEPRPIPRPEDVDVDAFRSALAMAWRSKDLKAQRRAVTALVEEIVLLPLVQRDRNGERQGEAVVKYSWKAEARTYTHQFPYGPP